MDEYGYPIGRVPGHRGMTATGHSSGAYVGAPGTITGEGMNPTGHSTGSGHHGLSAILHRSGSSSSSSSVSAWISRFSPICIIYIHA